MSDSDLAFSLGLDTDKFKVAGEQAAATAESIADKIEHHFSGKGLGQAIATAFGLNVEKLAEKAARLISGVSETEEESLKQMAELSERYADENMKAQREKLSAEDQYKLALQDRDRLEKQIAARQVKTSADQVAQYKDEIALLAVEKDLKFAASKEEIQHIQDVEHMRGFMEAIDKADAKAKQEAEQEDWNMYFDNVEIRKKKQEEINNKEKEITAELKRQADAEAAVAAAAAKEADALAKFAGNFKTTGRDNSELSDRELQQKIAGSKADIFSRQVALRGSAGGVGDDPVAGPYDPFLGIQQQNLAGAQAELDLREQVRKLASIFGSDTAANKLGLSDQRLQQILGTAADNSQQTNLLQSINDQLKKGLVTIPKQ